MRYIRTADGIFDIEKYGGIRTVVKIYDVDESLRLKYENTNEPQQVGDKFVGIENKDYKITDNNTADIIEELFDRFILIFTHSNNELCYRDDFDTLEEVLKFIDSYKNRWETVNVYGAVWSKGKHDEPILKSVAKIKGILLNGKIDWELL